MSHEVATDAKQQVSMNDAEEGELFNGKTKGKSDQT